MHKFSPKIGDYNGKCLIKGPKMTKIFFGVDVQKIVRSYAAISIQNNYDFWVVLVHAFFDQKMSDFDI